MDQVHSIVFKSDIIASCQLGRAKDAVRAQDDHSPFVLAVHVLDF